MEEPMKALIQSFARTKARNLAEYKKVMEAHTNSSNNTLYADADGNIAYFHSNFIPKRDPKFDWTKPVDGTNPATEWNGVLSFDESPNVVNPPNGWVYNTNNYPFSAAGAEHSPRQKDFPAYVDSGSENPRGIHAIRVLDGKKGFTVDSLIGAAYDSLLPEFEVQIPLLVKAYDAARPSHALKSKLAEPIGLLKGWDYRWSATSVPTAVAIFYGDDLWQRVTPAARKAGVSTYEYMRTRATAEQRLESLAAAVDKLQADFGKWQTPWGDINRFQRNDARNRAEVRRQQAEHAGDVHLRALGVAGLLRRPRLSRHEEVVRHQRQQLRGGDRVRRPGDGEGGDRRRPQQQSGVEAFQRSGGALRHRQPARRVFLPRAAEGPHRAGVQAGSIVNWQLTVDSGSNCCLEGHGCRRGGHRRSAGGRGRQADQGLRPRPLVIADERRGRAA